MVHFIAMSKLRLLEKLQTFRQSVFQFVPVQVIGGIQLESPCGQHDPNKLRCLSSLLDAVTVFRGQF